MTAMNTGVAHVWHGSDDDGTVGIATRLTQRREWNSDPRERKSNLGALRYVCDGESLRTEFCRLEFEKVSQLTTEGRITQMHSPLRPAQKVEQA